MGNDASLYGSGMKKKMIFWALAFTILIDGTVNGNFTYRQNFFKVDEKLRLLNKPAVKSIQSKDGDIIDCVDIYRQPAFDHPALKNHTIQMTPTYDAAMEPTTITAAAKEQKKETHLHTPTVAAVAQVWQRSGSCPKGTIPIRRIRKQDLLRLKPFSNYQHFGRKKPFFSHDHVPRNTTQSIHPVGPLPTNYSQHLHDINITEPNPGVVNRSAVILLTQGYRYTGAKADISVWNPTVEADDEYSSAQIWLKNGPYYNFESMESGWIVNPGVYGDRQTRLFSYWTTDSSIQTGCFDLTCPGFVQTSDEIALGAVIDGISSKGGPQYQITLYMFKDAKTSNWWLQFGNQINIGYWPAELFQVLSTMASYVEWGGEVYSSHVRENRPHTATNMGSGDFPGFLYGYDCFVRQIRIRDNSPELKFPCWVYRNVEEYDCYGGLFWVRRAPEPEFYFGGPGRYWRCP